MIVGIGTDILRIDRIQRIFSIYKEKFAKKILSKEEIGVFFSLNENIATRYLAKRFAAKEAVSKALGTGIGAISFKDISILNDESGKPFVKIISNNAEDKIQKYDILVSISDEKEIAIAFAVAYSYNHSSCHNS